MSLSAVVAVYADWGIGANGTQPVVIPEDRSHFVELTRGAAVIMGRRTLADFPGGRPLKGRVNILLTGGDSAPEGCLLAHTPAEAAALAGGYEKAFVLGGERVFAAMMPYVSRVYVTKLDAAPLSDVFFPDLDRDPEWICEDEGEALVSREGGIAYRFAVYARR